VYVGDVARAYLLAAISGAADIALNAGIGIETSLLQLCTAVCAAAGRPDLKPSFEAARKVNGVTRRCADVRQAELAIGFRAEVGLEAGLKALVDWIPTASMVAVE
jgi:UDP-glucose 4-epimerase